MRWIVLPLLLAALMPTAVAAWPPGHPGPNPYCPCSEYCYEYWHDHCCDHYYCPENYPCCYQPPTYQPPTYQQPTSTTTSTTTTTTQPPSYPYVPPYYQPYYQPYYYPSQYPTQPTTTSTTTTTTSTTDELNQLISTIENNPQAVQEAAQLVNTLSQLPTPAWAAPLALVGLALIARRR